MQNLSGVDFKHPESKKQYQLTILIKCYKISKWYEIFLIIY